MELWIRSQDKKLLVQAKEVKAEVFVGKKLYSPYTNEEIISFDGDDKFYVIRVNSEMVGEFKTEERCLEILDEVQKILTRTGTFVFSNVEPPQSEDEFRAFKKNIDEDGMVFLFSNFNNEAKCELLSSPVVTYQMPEE